MSHLLEVVYLASRLKLNMQKSNIYGVGVEGQEVLATTNLEGCNVWELPLTYLGLHVGVNIARKDKWK